MYKLFFLLPVFLQNTIISLVNCMLYSKRYGGNYKRFKAEIKQKESLGLSDLRQLQEKRAIAFLRYALSNSPFYRNKYIDIDINDITCLKDFGKLPILKKEELRENIKSVYTLSKKKGVVSKTGGTTGKPLEVLYTKEDLQKRFAFLDNFREKLGYKLGKKTAWFSGKKILSEKDVTLNRFWKHDYINKVRYYSTFHIRQKYLLHYIKDLLAYEPEYFVGFPSTLLEIAKYGIKHQIEYSSANLKAIFPTAESINPIDRNTIETYFKAPIYDQYASSEGAPFIFECSEGKLHLELLSGIFEILDSQNQPSNNGRLVLTSFSTHGTPLIRYDIGDSLILAPQKTCTCGNNNPIVSEILGRINDYVYSPETGKINLGNISNTLKGVKGVIKFQVIQNQIDALDISIIVDKAIFDKKDKATFLKNWTDRIGNNMTINLKEVNEIPREKSGKFRIAKNNIKDLIDN